MEGAAYDDATCAEWPLATPECSAAAANDDADAPFAASVGVAAGRERRLLLLLAGLRAFEGRAVPLGVEVA
jgi:hypothetical protein